MGAGTDQYGAQEPRNIPSELERWLPLPAAELTTIDQGSTRIRLALSTTTRGWDYESTVEITAPSSNLTPAERAELVELAAELQLRLRLRPMWHA